MKLQLTTGAVLFLAISAGQTSADDSGLLVSCSMENGAYERVYLLYPSNFLAQRVDGAEAVYGQLVDLGHVYKLDFLGTDTQPPHRAGIFRYTGKIEVEWGTQPFDMYSFGNTFQTGVCQTSKAQKMF